MAPYYAIWIPVKTATFETAAATNLPITIYWPLINFWRMTRGLLVLRMTYKRCFSSDKWGHLSSEKNVNKWLSTAEANTLRDGETDIDCKFLFELLHIITHYSTKKQINLTPSISSSCFYIKYLPLVVP